MSARTLLPGALGDRRGGGPVGSPLAAGTSGLVNKLMASPEAGTGGGPQPWGNQAGTPRGEHTPGHTLPAPPEGGPHLSAQAWAVHQLPPARLGKMQPGPWLGSAELGWFGDLRPAMGGPAVSQEETAHEDAGAASRVLPPPREAGLISSLAFRMHSGSRPQPAQVARTFRHVPHLDPSPRKQVSGTGHPELVSW